MRAELESVANSVRQIHDQLQQQHQRQQDLISDVRSAVVELAMAVATQVLGDSEVTKERVVGMVAETLDQLPQEQLASVFLHPMDAEFLEEFDIEEASGRQLLQVGADPNVPRGTCRVEGPHYGYVNHWKHYLATVRRNLLDQLND